MAAKEPEKAKTVEKAVPKPLAQVYETKYTIEELVAASATLFHEEQIVASAALKASGKAAYTEKEAKAIVKAFAKKEVK
ncbi:hypothetical protein OBO34_19575 [Clostridiales Family XIII bacterium ASD5510]|uniref:YqzN/YkzM domain-containing protein n=1 Tax=Hominibacterium faecale TaxID=2839743 RepID=A0A9J6QYF8_9FIRM|nr:hypothetical protein [Hominibacterium faecale]MCU7380516.1 hypothetical protein [Hominibacterium faecale]